MNEQDKITYRILLKLSLVWGNITRGTYNVENCNLKNTKKILRGLNKTAFDFIKLCQVFILFIFYYSGSLFQNYFSLLYKNEYAIYERKNIS